MVKSPEIRLIDHTRNPVEALLATWIQSRPTKYPEVFRWLKLKHGTEVITSDLLLQAIRDHVTGAEQESLDETFYDAVPADLPVSESVHFTWGYANLPIEWREQAVRKRLWGHWITSMREFTMQDFADEGRFCPPPDSSVSPQSIERFEEMMRDHHQQDYRELVDKWGWPPEKARKVVPLAATHNGAMFSTLRTLKDTLKSRSCWIAAIDQWGPWTRSVVDQLAQVDPRLVGFVTPPCLKRGSNEFSGCKYELINKNRLSGKDDYAPCPIYSCHHRACATERAWLEDARDSGTKPEYLRDALRLKDVWKGIWRRDPLTGEMIA